MEALLIAHLSFRGYFPGSYRSVIKNIGEAVLCRAQANFAEPLAAFARAHELSLKRQIEGLHDPDRALTEVCRYPGNQILQS